MLLYTGRRKQVDRWAFLTRAGVACLVRVTNARRACSGRVVHGLIVLDAFKNSCSIRLIRMAYCHRSYMFASHASEVCV